MLLVTTPLEVPITLRGERCLIAPELGGVAKGAREHLMTITAVTIQNFKGIGEAAGMEEAVRVDLKPITLLFGANSAGKSSVLQAMLYVREVLARRNTDPDLTQLGGEFVDL